MIQLARKAAVVIISYLKVLKQLKRGLVVNLVNFANSVHLLLHNTFYCALIFIRMLYNLVPVYSP